jgi:tetraacyldisaccharide 4'-kinase
MSLMKFWYKKSLAIYPLIPFSLIYRVVVSIKRLGYQRGWCKTTQFSVPVIVIGNLTVGGTGKTPFLIALANYLVTQGFKPGVVSRGYGAKARQFPLVVTPESDPVQAGDEPVLIARRTKCPVVIAPNRVAAVKTLLAQNDCDVVLSDDGLQHYAMGRALEIALVDGQRRFGNGWCLPAGSLREPVQRLGTVDFIVCQGEPEPGEWRMQLKPGELYNLRDPNRKFSDAKGRVVHAMAGIGNPSRFFQQLRDLGFVVSEHTFPDHYSYCPTDVDFGPDAIVIMTEKDAVKCLKFTADNLWCLPVTADCAVIKTIAQLFKEKQDGQNTRSFGVRKKVR